GENNPLGFPASTDVAAAADQAIYIIRTRTGREDIERITGMNWVPHILYSHLVLQDYLAARLPEPMAVCPDDIWRARWARDVPGFEQNIYEPYQPDATVPNNMRWAYSSSYQVVPAAYARGRPGNRLHQI